MSNTMFMPDELFPRSVNHKSTCQKTYGGYRNEFTNGTLQTFDDILLYMRHALLPPGTTKAQADKDAVLLGITMPERRCHVFAICLSFLATPANFSAEFVLCSLCDGQEYDEQLAPPFSVKLKTTTHFGKDILEFKTETGLARLLLEVAGQGDGFGKWSRLQYSLDDLQTLDVEGMEHLDLGTLVAQHKAQRSARLLQQRRQELLKRSLGKAKPKRKRAAGQTIKRSMQVRKRRKFEVDERQVDIIFEDDGEDQDDAQSVESGEEVWQDIQDDGADVENDDHDVVVEQVEGAPHKFTAKIDGKVVGRIQYTNVSDNSPLQASLHVACHQGHGSKCRDWKTFKSGITLQKARKWLADGHLYGDINGRNTSRITSDC